jgi:hypothetical protein
MIKNNCYDGPRFLGHAVHRIAPAILLIFDACAQTQPGGRFEL